VIATKRIACALIPRFGLSLHLRDAPELLSRPVALTDGVRESAAILQVNDQATRAGIKVGMTAAQGGMLSPELVIKVRNQESESKESQQVLGTLQQVAPFIAVDAQGVYFIEAVGLAGLYGSEAGLAMRVVDAIKALGLPVRVGIADNNYVARVAAEVSSHHAYTIVPPQTGRRFLKPLAIKYLAVSGETRAQLQALGLTTIGQVAALPVNELMERFGREGWLLAKLSHGECPDYFHPETPPDDWREKVFLSFSICRAETIVDYTRMLLEKLFKRLKALGRVCTQVAITLKCDDHNQYDFEVGLDKPTLSVGKFLRQLRVKLERLVLSAGVVEINAAPVATESLVAEQLQLPQSSGKKGSASLPVKAVIGTSTPGELYRSILCHRSLPEKSYQIITGESFSGALNMRMGDVASYCDRPYTLHLLTGLRLIDPCRQIQVVVDKDAPRLIIIDRKQQQVKRLHGPWVLSGGWWGDGFDRRYYDIETDQHRAYLLYSDRTSSRWFLQGIFD
jgi:protein ImuB